MKFMFQNIALAKKFFLQFNIAKNVKNIKKCSALKFCKDVFHPTQPAFASSKLTVETLEQGAK